MTVSKEIRQEQIEHLRKLLPHDSTVYTIRIHTLRQSKIGIYAPLVVVDGRISNIHRMASNVTGRKWHEKGGVAALYEQDIVVELGLALHNDSLALKHVRL